ARWHPTWENSVATAARFAATRLPAREGGRGAGTRLASPSPARGKAVRSAAARTSQAHPRPTPPMRCDAMRCEGYAPPMNRLLPLILAVAGFAAALSPADAYAQTHADTILVGGKVWTGNPRQPEAEAVAILDGKVAAVGSDAEVRRWAGPDTRVLELRGRRVVPGFNDAHVHFFDGGQ